MSDLTEVLLPTGLLLLGAYVVKRFMDNQQTPPTCEGGDVNQTCIGPICWATCQKTGGSTGTQGTLQDPFISSPTGPGTFTGTTNTGSPCANVGPLEWWMHPECWKGGTIGW